eukprot:1161520-Pelagomonas_calceolata.AAC.1
MPRRLCSDHLPDDDDDDDDDDVYVVVHAEGQSGVYKLNAASHIQAKYAEHDKYLACFACYVVRAGSHFGVRVGCIEPTQANHAGYSAASLVCTSWMLQAISKPITQDVQ